MRFIVVNDVGFNSHKSCWFSWEVWETIHKYFQFLHIAYHHRTLKAIKTPSSRQSFRTIEKYVMHIKQIQESTRSLGDSVPHYNLIEIAFEALPSDYDLVIAIFNSKDKPCKLDKLKLFLLQIK